MWCALQMAGKDVPQLRILSASNGVPQPSLGTAATSAAEATATLASDETKPEGNNDSNNNTTKSSTWFYGFKVVWQGNT